jgi:hypothetical protein
VNTPNRDYFITAESGKEMFDWVQSLKVAQAIYCSERPSGKTAASLDVRTSI